MAEQLTKAGFEPHLNTTFRAFYAEGQFLELELIEVSDPDERRARKPRWQERFSLLFRGPADTMLPHSTYLFRHEAMGDFDLSISPVEQDARGVYYEAVFNRVFPRE